MLSNPPVPPLVKISRPTCCGLHALASRSHAGKQGVVVLLLGHRPGRTDGNPSHIGLPVPRNLLDTLLPPVRAAQRPAADDATAPHRGPQRVPTSSSCCVPYTVSQDTPRGKQKVGVVHGPSPKQQKTEDAANGTRRQKQSSRKWDRDNKIK